MDLLMLTLALAGLLAGFTGTWSPCGLSMIETIGPAGHRGGPITTLAASVAFGPFAVLGGLLTFGSLSLLGGLIHGAGEGVAVFAAAIIALVAAYADARGLPIVPQVRRQLPVRWRQTHSMALAAAGYGVLLGLGFTTFVLSYGVWALMGICLALGELEAGLVVGATFGLGRAIPILALAPVARTRTGARVCDAMVLNRGLYRGARLGDGAVFACLGLVLLAGNATADARPVASRAADPSAFGALLAYQDAKGVSMIKRGQKPAESLRGRHPAVGGRWIAVVRGSNVVLLDRDSLEEVSRRRIKGVTGLAVSRNWLALRRTDGVSDRISAISVGGQGQLGSLDFVARVRHPAQLSRPALSGSRLIHVSAKQGGNKLVRTSLRSGKNKKRTLIHTKTHALAAPSIDGRTVAYVQIDRRGRQSIHVREGKERSDRSVYRMSSRKMTLWNIALTSRRLYYTKIKRGGTSRLFSRGLRGSSRPREAQAQRRMFTALPLPSAERLSCPLPSRGSREPSSAVLDVLEL